MSQALGHFAVGAAGMTILIALVPLRVPFRQTVVLLGGGWAMAPDIYKLAPTYTGWMEAIHDSTAGNVFWFHRLLDGLDPTDSYLVTAVLVGMWIGVTVAVEGVRILRPTGTIRVADGRDRDQPSD